MMRRAVNQVLEERRVGGNVNNGIRRGNQSRHAEIKAMKDQELGNKEQERKM